MTRYRFLRGTIVALAALAVLVLAVSLGARVAGAAALRVAKQRYEREVGSLDLTTFERRKLPAAENAVTWLRPGTQSVVLLDGDRALIGALTSSAPREWTADEIAKLEAILDRNAPAVTLLERARPLRQSNWDIRYRDGTTAKLPDLLAAVNAGKLLFARARLASLRGDRETALTSVETLGALARSLEAESSLIVQLIGTAVERWQLAEVNALLASPLTTVGDLRRLESSLPDVDPIAQVRTAFRADTAAVAHDVHSEALLQYVPRILPRTLAVGLADLWAAAALRARVRYDSTIGEPITAQVIDGAAHVTRSGWWGELAELYGPNVAMTAARATATASARDLARLAIALRRERESAPAYPSMLPTSSGVPATDPLSGKPWEYSVRPDGTAEVGSAATEAIVRGIFVTGWLSYDALYRWTLPPLAPSSGRN